ncbi:hypothetical protein AB0H43_03035 [Hamadaea sp. NPDC050747]|uniref:hypothetical protein n=1 Tax=Hamadaea sp. NPDC050747 TaxID=3155789 RepID=UPI0033E72B8A
MAWDSVPWFVGGGAQHSPEVARLLAYSAMRGNEGIVGSGDLAVKALAVPGASVRVLPGACSIINRASGGNYQVYAGRLISEDTVPIAATGSGSGRSDLVVARVEDPWLAGEPWPDPVDPTVGPYIFTRVISGVPSTTKTVTELGLGYSAIPLARIDIPASTGTITAGMIVDLRKVANPRRERSVFTVNPGATNTLTSTAFTAWPSAASWSVAVPSWATKAIVRASIGGVNMAVGIAHGEIRVSLGTVTTQGTGYDETVPTGAVLDRKFWRCADTVTIPSAMQGTTQTLRIEGYRASGATASVAADTASSCEIDIEFIEVAA